MKNEKSVDSYSEGVEKVKITEEQASSLALLKVLKGVDLSKSELESTVISLLEHLYQNDVNKIIYFIEEISTVKTAHKNEILDSLNGGINAPTTHT